MPTPGIRWRTPLSIGFTVFPENCLILLEIPANLALEWLIVEPASNLQPTF
jgi:hypothetical protein